MSGGTSFFERLNWNGTPILPAARAAATDDGGFATYKRLKKELQEAENNKALKETADAVKRMAK